MDFNIIKNKMNNKGFTVVELVVMIGIIAVISALVIGAVASLMNGDAGNEQNARSMYYSMQNLMSNIKLSAVLPKNDTGRIDLYYNDTSNNWHTFTTTEYKNYYFELKVKDCAIEEFRFVVSEAGMLLTALAYSGGDGDYGDYGGSFYSQYADMGNDAKDDIWKKLKERIEPFVTDDENEGEWYYFIAADSEYRVSKVYYSRVPFSDILGKTFSGDSYIDDVGKVAAFPASLSKRNELVTG